MLRTILSIGLQWRLLWVCCLSFRQTDEKVWGWEKERRRRERDRGRQAGRRAGRHQQHRLAHPHRADGTGHRPVDNPAAGTALLALKLSLPWERGQQPVGEQQQVPLLLPPLQPRGQDGHAAAPTLGGPLHSTPLQHLQVNNMYSFTNKNQLSLLCPSWLVCWRWNLKLPVT